MFELSPDPNQASEELEAIIWYLTAFAAIDGDLDLKEKIHIKQVIREILRKRIQTTGGEDSDPLVSRYATLFEEVFERVCAEVQNLLYESVADAESHEEYLVSRLEECCYSVFFRFDEAARIRLLSAADALLAVDGILHPAEVALREQLSGLTPAAPKLELPNQLPPRQVIVAPIRPLSHTPSHSEFFRWFEYPYSSDPKTFRRQAEADVGLVRQAMEVLQARKDRGRALLAGKRTIQETIGMEPFLDSVVQVIPPRPGKALELTVVGDLHGCYTCLKAALQQSRFLDKVATWQKSPFSIPFPAIVFLGDYLDRGRFGFDGVLRLVLYLLVQYPDHVFPLRGNHEYIVFRDGRFQSGVVPSESDQPFHTHGASELLRPYRDLFERLPVSLFLGPLLFTHAGIPKESLLKESWRDLSSLNDPRIAYQMIWSDPSRADVVPAALQQKSVRFTSGKYQILAFLQRIGCHTLIRGHQAVSEGFRLTIDHETGSVYTLFSAGGATNPDLPENSEYRKVTPMALTVTVSDGWDGPYQIQPWPIDWETYADPSMNGFLM